MIFVLWNALALNSTLSIIRATWALFMFLSTHVCPPSTSSPSKLCCFRCVYCACIGLRFALITKFKILFFFLYNSHVNPIYIGMAGMFCAIFMLYNYYVFYVYLILFYSLRFVLFALLLLLIIILLLFFFIGTYEVLSFALLVSFVMISFVIQNSFVITNFTVWQISFQQYLLSVL